METTLTEAIEIAAQPDGPAGIAAQEFDRIVGQYQRRIYRLLFTLTRDVDAAETLTQECFFRAYNKRASFRGEGSMERWLAHIAVNLARDHGRNRRRAFWRRLFSGATASDPAEMAQRVADPRASPEEELLAREDVGRVWAVVGELSPQQRAVFLLRFAEEMALEEIAGAMEMKVGTVKSHLCRAVGAVRKRLKEPD